MAKTTPPIPKPATGCVGFGCAFTLVALGLMVVMAPASPSAVVLIVGVAMVVGLLTAWLGEPFFERVLGFVRWFH